jgi:Bacterial aa3 type cytochrome c oxidase subunit IV
MSVNDDYQNHLQTWRGFTRFIQIMTATVILVVVVLALITL